MPFCLNQYSLIDTPFVLNEIPYCPQVEITTTSTIGFALTDKEDQGSTWTKLKSWGILLGLTSTSFFICTLSNITVFSIEKKFIPINYHRPFFRSILLLRIYLILIIDFFKNIYTKFWIYFT